jgi:hypothetical protein
MKQSACCSDDIATQRIAARRALGSMLATFCSGIDNTIGFIGRTAVTLKFTRLFEDATNKNGSGRHG